jgi:hypothetical protein
VLGVLAVIGSGEGDAAEIASVLKLDAVTEAASYKFDGGQVRLSVLKDLLPAPGELSGLLALLPSSGTVGSPHRYQQDRLVRKTCDWTGGRTTRDRSLAQQGASRPTSLCLGGQ